MSRESATSNIEDDPPEQVVDSVTLSPDASVTTSEIGGELDELPAR